MVKVPSISGYLRRTMTRVVALAAVGGLAFRVGAQLPVSQVSDLWNGLVFPEYELLMPAMREHCRTAIDAPGHLQIAPPAGLAAGGAGLSLSDLWIGGWFPVRSTTVGLRFSGMDWDQSEHETEMAAGARTRYGTAERSIAGQAWLARRRGDEPFLRGISVWGSYLDTTRERWERSSNRDEYASYAAERLVAGGLRFSGRLLAGRTLMVELEAVYGADSTALEYRDYYSDGTSSVRSDCRGLRRDSVGVSARYMSQPRPSCNFSLGAGYRLGGATTRRKSEYDSAAIPEMSRTGGNPFLEATWGRRGALGCVAVYLGQALRAEYRFSLDRAHSDLSAQDSSEWALTWRMPVLLQLDLGKVSLYSSLVFRLRASRSHATGGPQPDASVPNFLTNTGVSLLAVEYAPSESTRLAVVPTVSSGIASIRFEFRRTLGVRKPATSGSTD